MAWLAAAQRVAFGTLTTLLAEDKCAHHAHAAACRQRGMQHVPQGRWMVALRSSSERATLVAHPAELDSSEVLDSATLMEAAIKERVSSGHLRPPDSGVR